MVFLIFILSLAVVGALVTTLKSRSYITGRTPRTGWILVTFFSVWAVVWVISLYQIFFT